MLKAVRNMSIDKVPIKKNCLRILNKLPYTGQIFKQNL